MFDGLKVLLVEDDPTVREGSEQALQLAGLDVLAFHSAELAYKLLTPDFPGIALTTFASLHELPGLLQSVRRRFNPPAVTSLQAMATSPCPCRHARAP